MKSIQAESLRQIIALSMGANALNKEAIDSGDPANEKVESVSVLLDIQVGLAISLQKSITEDDPPTGAIIVPDT